MKTFYALILNVLILVSAIVPLRAQNFDRAGSGPAPLMTEADTADLSPAPLAFVDPVKGQQPAVALARPANDDLSSALDVTSLINASCTSGGSFTTKNATPDQSKAPCWSSGPNNNVWFRFTATSKGAINVKVIVNGPGETLQYSMLAIFDAGLNPVACEDANTAAVFNDCLGVSGLIPGNTYYIAVDNASSADAGRFDLCLTDVPLATISYSPGTFCASGTTTVTRNGQAGGTYSSSSGLAIDPASGSIDLGASTPGTYTVSYNFTNGTCSDVATASVKVNAVPLATISYAPSSYFASSVFCASGTATVTRTGQAGGIYSSTTGLAIDAASGSIDLVASIPGTYTVNYNLTSGSCSSMATTSLTINALPTAAISYGGSPYCASGTATVTQTGQTGGTYSSAAGLSINPATGAINLTGSTSGTYTITYSYTNGTCNNTTTTSVVVNTLPVAAISYTASAYYAASTFCAAGTATVTQTGQTGGSYSSTPGLSLNATSGSIDLAGSTPGTYTVTYSFSNGACSNTAVTSVTVSPLPTATIAYTGTPYCATGMAAVTRTGVAGGTYSAAAGLSLDAVTGAVNLATSAAGTYTVTYAFSNGTCSNTATATITVISSVATAAISYTGNPYCAAGTATVTRTGQAGGNYSSTTGLIIDAATGTINLVSSTAGTYTVTYVFPNGACSNSSSTSTMVTINPLPAAAITYTGSPYCASGTAAVTQTGQTGGTYSGVAGLSIDGSTGTINLGSSIPGTYTVTYTFSNGTCNNTATTTVTIHALAAATISYTPNPYYAPGVFCNTGTATVTQTGQTGGTYASAAGLALNTVTGNIDLAASLPGTYTITYSFTNGTCPNSTTSSVTITALPTAAISYAGNPYCATGTTTVPQTGQGGGTYSSAAGLSIDPTSGTVNLASSAAGTYTVTYTFSNGTCPNTTTTTLTINPLPVATISYAAGPSYTSSSYCASATATVTRTGQGGGTYSSTAGLSLNAATGSVDLSASTPGTYTVTYTFTNGTCSGSATGTLTIVALPSLTITNPASVCAPTAVDLTAPAVTAGSSSGLTFSYFTDAAATTPLSNPNAVSTPGTYYIEGTNASSCSSIQPVVATFNPMPSATISYSGNPYCVSGTASVSQSGQTGGIYSSTTGLSLNASTGAINLSGSTPGTYTVTYGFTNGTCSNTTTAPVTIQALPTATISYPGSPYCASGAAAVTQTGQAGGTYSSTTGLTLDAASGAIDLGASTPGTYTVSYTFSNGTCNNTTTAAITVNALPTATIVYGGSPYCATGMAAVTRTGQTGGAYSTTAGLSLNATTGAINLATSTPGAYTVTYSFTNGTCSYVSTTTATVTVIAAPTATIAYSGSPYCATGTVMATQTGQTGGTYSAAAGLTIDAATGTISPSVSTPGTYTVTYTFGNGVCNATATTAITILNPTPTAAVSYAGSPYCAMGTATASQTGQGGGIYSSTTGLTLDAATGAVNLATSTPGTYTVTYNFGNGACSGSTTGSLVINALPFLTINNPAPVCPPATIDLTDPAVTAGSSGGLTFGYYTNSGATTVLSNPNAVATGGIYYIKATNASSCFIIQPVTVSFNTRPSASISYPGSPYCVSGTATVSQSGQTGGTYSCPSSGLVIDPSTGTIDLGISIPGTYTVTYTFSNGTCTNTATATVTINALPVATISYDASPYCATGTAAVSRTGQGGGSYSSTTGLHINTSTGAISLASSTPGTYTVTYVFGSGTCSNSTTCQVTVIAQPTLIITNPAAVCSPATIDLTDPAVTAGSSSGLTLSYYTDAAATIVLSNPNAVNAGGTYYIEGTSTNGCSSIKAVVASIKTPPTATIAYTGSPYCATGTTVVTQTGQGGGAYSAATGLSLNATTGSVDLSASTPGAYTVTYTFTNGTCGGSATGALTIVALPSLTITNPAPVCAPATIDLTAPAVTAGSSSGLTFTYFTDAAATTTLANAHAVSTAGTYYIKGTNASSCFILQPVTVSFNTMPSATISYSGNPYCVSGTASVSQSGQTGGTYSSTTGLSLNASTGAINLSGSTPGTYTVTYNFTNGTCSNSTTAPVTIQAMPTATISYTGSPYCASGSATVTQTGQAGGTYSSTTGLTLDAASGAIDLGSSTAGTYTVTYSFGNGTCSNNATTTITVNALPIATISYGGSPYCATGMATVTQTGQAGGFYSSTAGLSIHAANGTIDLAASTPGTYTVTYTFTNGSCSNSSTAAVTINALSTATITYNSSPYHATGGYCPTGTATVTQTGQTGGTYSAGAGLIIDASTGDIDLAASTPATYTVTYHFISATCGGMNTATASITISPLPVATISYTASPYCATGTANVNRTGQTGGSYSSTAGLTVDGVTGTVNLATSTPGTYTVVYSFNNGNCNNTASTTITVNALPTASIAYPGSPYCAFGTATVTMSGQTGGIYSSTTGLVVNPATGAINLASSTPGTYVITYTMNNGTCSNTATASMTLVSLPTAAISYPSAYHCATGTTTATRTGQAGGTFSAPVGLSIDPATGTIDLGSSNAGTYIVTYSFTNGTCNNTTTTTVTVRALPAAAISYAPSPYYASSPFCAVGVATVTQTGQTGGTYSSAAGLSIDAATGSVNLGSSAPGTYTITYSFTNGVCHNTATTTMTIISPASIATIAYPGTPYCATGIAAVSLSGQGGGTYSAATGLTIDPVTGTIDLGASAPGTYTVTYSYSTGTCSGNATTTVSIVAVANAAISYASGPYSASTSYCATGTATVTQTGQTGGTYSAAAGLIIDASTGEINLSASTAGTYIITYSFTNGNCHNASTTTATVTINAVPPASIAYAASPFCASGTAAVTRTGQAGGTYYSTVGLNIDAVTGDIDLGASTAGTYTVTYSFSNGTCNNATTTLITIHPLPAATISYAPSPYYATSTYCSIGTAPVTQTGQTGGTYSSTAGLSIDASTGEINLTASTPGTYVVTYAFADGMCSNTTTARVTIVNTSATATIAYPSSPYCGMGVATVVRTGQTGGYYSSTAGLSIDFLTGNINMAASTPGNYTVTYSFSSGTCVGNTTATIQINTPPMVSINNPGPVCMPGSIDLTDPAITTGSESGLSFAYYSDQAGTIPIANPSAITSSSIYFVQGSNSISCKSVTMPVTAIISERPSIIASGDSIICRGTTASLSASSTGNTLQWLGINGGDNIVVRPDSSTNYTVIATNVSGCTDTAVLPVRVIDFSLKLTADPAPVLAGTNLVLTSSSDSAYQVLAWTPQSEFSDQTAISQSFIVNDSSQLFKVIGRSSWGCVDTAVLIADVTPNIKDFFIPNAFSPNGDGMNDVFKAYGASIKEIDLRVFNQWGQVIFETKDPQGAWNGTYGGNKQPASVYIYVVRAVLYGEKIITRRGTVTLIR